MGIPVSKHKIGLVVLCVLVFGFAFYFVYGQNTQPSSPKLHTNQVLSRKDTANETIGVAPQENNKSSDTAAPNAPPAESTPAVPAEKPQYIVQSEGIRRVVSDSDGWVATFTVGSRSVTVKGGARTFNENGSGIAVTHNIWVRLLNVPFDGTVDRAWLNAALTDKSPDVLAYAMQYLANAASITNASGQKIAGDASYGPLLADGTRQEGSDYTDYLGVSVVYPDGTDAPESAQLGALDCSGYMRMVWGYRAGVGMSRTTAYNSSVLPRRAVQMYALAPGVIIAPVSTPRNEMLQSARVGDLVFFNVSADDGSAIDHVGMFMGVDQSGHYRFVSSRKQADGPTMGDVGGASILDGSGLYARNFVAIRRI